MGFNNDDGLGIRGLGEAEGDGGAAVADGFVAGDALRAVEVAEGGVVEAVKDVRADGAEIADVDVTLAVAGGGTEDGEVAHGDDGTALCESATRGELRDVVIADGGTDLLMHGGDRFTSGSLAEVTLTQKGHGGDDRAAEIDEVVPGVAEDMHLEVTQQLARGVEVGGGVVVAAGDDGLHGFEVGETLQEVEVERHGLLRRIRGIKDIAAEQQRVDFLATEGFDEPVHEGSVLSQAIPLDEAGTEMPVGGVEEAHAAL